MLLVVILSHIYSACCLSLSNEKYEGDLLLQKTLIEDFLTHKLVKNKGQLPQFYVENAHAPIVPRSVFERAADELWLRSIHGRRGGIHFGSRTALKGRTYCPCGMRMKLLKRNESVYICEACKTSVLESDIQQQVMAAIETLPRHQAEIKALISESQQQANTEDRQARAMARRREWYLGNLLPVENSLAVKAECVTEADFRSRTQRKISVWNDDQIVRILEKVVPGEYVVFKGGFEV